MKKVVLYIAMSLDGYIADSTGGVSWLTGDGSDTANPGSYDAFIATIDTVILGYKTYHQIITKLSPDTWVYSGKKCYVLTHRPLASNREIIFTDKPVHVLIPELKNTAEKDIWICGGADIVTQCLRASVIDKLRITIAPVILGNGIRLFDVQPKPIRLQLISTNTYNGFTEIEYDIFR